MREHAGRRINYQELAQLADKGNVETWRIRLLLFLLVAPGSFAQSRSDWHFWTAADGLKESYSRKMSIGTDGRLWIRHGSIPVPLGHPGRSRIMR
jgi:hypothetical protein